MLTSNLKIFVTILIPTTITYNIILYDLVGNLAYERIIIVSGIYSAITFISGLLLGKHDQVKNTRINLGFAYHLATFVVVGIIGLSMFYLNIRDLNKLMIVSIGYALWALGMLIHYLISRRTIKGMSSTGLFK